MEDLGVHKTKIKKKIFLFADSGETQRDECHSEDGGEGVGGECFNATCPSWPKI
jgi:hypothetical protein